MEHTFKHLVVDSSVLFKNTEFINDCDCIYVTDEIVREIKDSKSKNRLGNIPHNWIVRNPLVHIYFINFVKLFTLKIGENKALSEADISIISLTLDLEYEVGEPEKIKLDLKQINSYDEESPKNKLPGFYLNPNDNDWISPKNTKQVPTFTLNLTDQNINVVCATSDFAIQNTCLHLGLNVISPSGKIIKELRKFIYVCSCCQRFASFFYIRICDDKTRKFCFYCGYDSLKKTSYIINDKGERTLFLIKNEKNVRSKDNSWMSTLQSIRKHGGVVINEDQLHQHRHKNTAKQQSRKTELLDFNGFPIKPFTTRDTNSRSFTHGLQFV
ncbi:hypothetical protein HZS_6984 [Henneguya salminicola]|nr:hypothetical protein HZS_6984 [Henneguya salminicola]